MKILCVGPLFRGSNAGAFFRALARNGVFIEVLDEFYHIPLTPSSLQSKIISKASRPIFINDFNTEFIRLFHRFKPDVVLVYKGAFVKSSTLEYIKSKGGKLINFYPDVSFHTHGNLLQDSLKLYDKVFTTKSFGIKDMELQLGIKNSCFIPHGFDPEIHRPIPKDVIPADFFCDVSFIGTYSPKKEKILSYLMDKNPSLDLKIWGSQWEKSKAPNLKGKIQLGVINGDLYAAGITASKINLAILSEQVRGASSGDLITSRTFHIPAAGGFMIHEENKESILYFKKDEEAVFFKELDELDQKINFYLTNEDLRIQIARNGRDRCLNDHSLDNRAKVFLENL
ncbi:CgeB family protein [Mongoliitalea lutea]|uniref:Spore protein YkvP/CgeB glycosyl transferase-like domain-containing protein n=1 Tax=Mongoliitalea lutea TaxID=849756 RepID=A0A8J3CV46_9BACT|nr:glycosyltransferase [Mongoliitalea lutea]GHB31382.1 hypothetical protein GCM10008106_10140 [Mongoliitalea lutea]